MDDKNRKKSGKDLPIIESAYEEIARCFEKERATFEDRKTSIAKSYITQVSWSSRYLDFYPKESLLDQLKPVEIYSKERCGSIKNLWSNNDLIFSCHNDNENWGCLFIEYHSEIKKSLFFVENDQGEMELRRFRLAYMEEGKYNKVLSYTVDSDDNEETLIIDYFRYEEYGISQIIRYGFWEDCTKRLPIRIFHFTPSGRMSITTTSIEAL